jgi:cytochrome P450
MRKRRVPPAPIPSEREFGRLELLLRLRRNPLTIWRQQHFRDPVVAGKSVLGYGVVLSDPAAIRHVLVDNVANYQKDALQRAILAPGLGEGLLTVEGESWKRARRTLAPLFTPKRVEALAARMLPPIANQVARMAKQRPGRVVDIADDMTRLTYDVLSETLFSNSIAGGAAAFGQALTRYFATQGQIDPLDVLGAPTWLPRIGRIRARPAIKFFERQIETIVADRQALHRTHPLASDPRDRDLLDALLAARDPETGVGLSDEEVGANIVTFIGAGHETTANALTWSLYLIATTPDIRESLEAEADDVATDPIAAVLAGDRLTMTRAVIEEAMRLYPPVPSLSRVALAADEASGTKIPKGALVIVSPYVLHRHETLWNNPAEFRPERFLPGQRETIPRFAYLPLGPARGSASGSNSRWLKRFQA